MVRNKLKEIRYSYQMTQIKFAELLDVPYPKYNLYENHKSVPRSKIMLKIAKKLNKHVDDIFYIEDN